MICPKCKREGLKSRVYPRGGSTTLMYCQPYYDEDGRYHHHDSNTATTNYDCSEGHRWTSKEQGSCWCGWGEDSEPRIIELEDAKPIPVINAEGVTTDTVFM